MVMISAWVMMVTWMVGAEATLLDQPAYLDSYSVQDSCQFSLCGPEYGQVSGYRQGLEFSKIV